VTTQEPSTDRPVWPDPEVGVDVVDDTDAEVAAEQQHDEHALVVDDGPAPDERFDLLVARAVVAFAVTALVLLAATFVLTLAAVWTTGTTSDNLGLSALTCAAGFGVALALVGTAPRVLR